MSKIEVLAPAGSMESLDYALMYGADAVYLAGRKYGMRAGADNFGEEELCEAVSKAHSKNVQVYLTCNTVARNDEVASLPDFLALARQAQVDGLIISDLGVMSVAKRVAPDIPLHISTQTGVANYETARMLYELGAQRVVLARELPMEDIAQIRAKTPSELEIECFVHGSMCVSFSGRCLLSNYMTGRDANRGECAQPCRWKYALMEEKREGEYFPVFEDERGTHILNSRDMCLIEYLPQLVDAGVTSLKIEGRAKSSYYVAVVTNAYRCAVDDYLRRRGDEDYRLPDWLFDEVCKVSHREYSTGFFLGGEPGQVLHNGGYVREYEVSAIVERCESGMIIASQRNKFSLGDTLEILTPGRKPTELKIERMLDGDDNPIDSTPHPMMTVKIPYGGDLPSGAILRRKK
ncbi:MAG: U32 family peptidase [Clostridia bacterium]|nr:U32 family peptidase [Clostridia bacterium]